MEASDHGTLASRNDLASLALHAAAEIAALSRNQATKNTYRVALAKRLRGDIHRDDNGPVRVALSPIATKVVAETLDEEGRAETLSDLYDAVQSFLKSLEAVKGGEPGSTLSDLKQKCLALHLALIRRSALAGEGKSHPYKYG